jgi:hypothetical protein
VAAKETRSRIRRRSLMRLPSSSNCIDPLSSLRVSGVITANFSPLTDIQDDIVEGKLDDVVGNLLCNAPALDDLIDFWSSLLRDLVKDW